MKKAATALLLLCPLLTGAQSFFQKTHAWQQEYKQEFLTDPRSPLKAADTSFLLFYEPDISARVAAKAVLLRNEPPTPFATHSGKVKMYRRFAMLHFTAPGYRSARHLTLTAYERVPATPTDTAGAGLLFLPFNDLTNGTETYGGGRYIDLAKADVKENAAVIIDFNRAYNPYCAFGGGYSCPIPPDENKLKAYIRAGEKLPAPPLGAKD